MLRATPLLRALDNRDAVETGRTLTYERAADIVAGLWQEALLLNPDLGADWLDDVQCDIAIARTLNARPRAD